jgi:hypothetical protein
LNLDPVKTLVIVKRIIEQPEGKDIPGYSGYLITRDGRVYNKITKSMVEEQISGGNYYVTLEGKRIQCDRLVAENYIPNPDNHPNVFHLNADQQDNRVENLIWQEQSYDNPSNRIPVKQSTQTGEIIAIYDSIYEAVKKTGISKTNITEACKGNRKQSNGFIWECVTMGPHTEEEIREFEKIKSRTAEEISKLTTENKVVSKYPEPKSVQQLALDGTVIAVFPSIRHACKDKTFTRYGITQACEGGKEIYGGYKWRLV